MADILGDIGVSRRQKTLPLAQAEMLQMADRELLIVGGYGLGPPAPASASMAWRATWETLRIYGNGRDPQKEELERAQRCNHYATEGLSLRLAPDGSAAWASVSLSNGAQLLRRTGATLTPLPCGKRALHFGGHCLQHEPLPDVTTAWSSSTLDLCDSCSSLSSAAIAEDGALRSGRQGGLHANSDLRLVHLGEMRVQLLRPHGTPPARRAYHTSSLACNRVLLIGGYWVQQQPGPSRVTRMPEAKFYYDVHAVDVDGTTWQSVHVIGRPPVALCRHSACVQLGQLAVPQRQHPHHTAASDDTALRNTPTSVASSSLHERVLASRRLLVYGGCYPRSAAVKIDNGGVPVAADLGFAGRGGCGVGGAATGGGGGIRVSNQLHALDCYLIRGRMCAAQTGLAGCQSDEANQEHLYARWVAISTQGDPPGARCGHAAVMMGCQMLVHGGMQLARSSCTVEQVIPRLAHDLCLLDCNGGAYVWTRVQQTPIIRREAHSLVQLTNTVAILFGGWTSKYHRDDTYLAPWASDAHLLHVPSLRWMKLRNVNSIPCRAPEGRFGHAGVVVDRGRTAARMSFLMCDKGLHAEAGGEVHLVICARGEHGLPRLSGGDSFAVNVVSAKTGYTAETPPWHRRASQQCPCVISHDGSLAGPAQKVSDNLDGTYSVVIVPTQAGIHQIHCTLAGEALRDSPYRMDVVSSTPEALCVHMPCHCVQLGSSFNVSLWPRDRFGNPVLVETLNLEVKPTWGQAYVPSRSSLFWEQPQVGDGGQRCKRETSLDSSCCLSSIALVCDDLPPAKELKAKKTAGAVAVFSVDSSPSQEMMIQFCGMADGKWLLPCTVNLRATGEVACVHASFSDDTVASPCQPFGPLSVWLADASGMSVTGISFDYTLEVMSEREHNAVSVAVVHEEWCKDGHDECAGLRLMLQLEGIPQVIQLVVKCIPHVNQHSRESTGRAIASNPLRMHLTGPPYFLRCSFQQPVSSNELTASESIDESMDTVDAMCGETCSRHAFVWVCDAGGNAVVGVPFRPKLQIMHFEEMQLTSNGKMLEQGDVEVAKSTKCSLRAPEFHLVKASDWCYRCEFAIRGITGHYKLHFKDTGGSCLQPFEAIEPSKLSVRLLPGHVCPSQCSIEGHQACSPLPAGEELTLMVTTCDSWGNRIVLYPGDVRAPVKVIAGIAGNSHLQTNVRVEPRGDSLHAVVFSLARAGRYKLTILVDGQHVRESPLDLAVCATTQHALRLAPCRADDMLAGMDEIALRLPDVRCGDVGSLFVADVVDSYGNLCVTPLLSSLTARVVEVESMTIAAGTSGAAEVVLHQICPRSEVTELVNASECDCTPALALACKGIAGIWVVELQYTGSTNDVLSAYAVMHVTPGKPQALSSYVTQATLEKRPCNQDLVPAAGPAPLGLASAGASYALTIQVCDRYSNACLAEDAREAVTVRAQLVRPAPGSLASRGNGVTLHSTQVECREGCASICTFEITCAGLYDIWVCVSGSPISGFTSPWPLLCIAGQPFQLGLRSEVSSKGPVVEHGAHSQALPAVCGEPIGPISLLVTDRYGNVVDVPELPRELPTDDPASYSAHGHALRFFRLIDPELILHQAHTAGRGARSAMSQAVPLASCCSVPMASSDDEVTMLQIPTKPHILLNPFRVCFGLKVVSQAGLHLLTARCRAQGGHESACTPLNAVDSRNGSTTQHQPLHPAVLQVLVTAGVASKLDLTSVRAIAARNQVFGPLLVSASDSGGNQAVLNSVVERRLTTSATTSNRSYVAGAIGRAPQRRGSGLQLPSTANVSNWHAASEHHSFSTQKVCPVFQFYISSPDDVLKLECSIDSLDWRASRGGHCTTAAVHLLIPPQTPTGPALIHVHLSQQEAIPASIPIHVISGLSFYSENHDIAASLRELGWQSVDVNARYKSHLQWTIKAATLDFGEVPPGQLVNHFEQGTSITTKVGLQEALSTAWANKPEERFRHPSSFFPRSYDLSDEGDTTAFIADFKLTAARCIVRRFVAVRTNISCAGVQQADMDQPDANITFLCSRVLAAHLVSAGVSLPQALSDKLGPLSAFGSGGSSHGPCLSPDDEFSQVELATICAYFSNHHTVSTCQSFSLTGTGGIIRSLMRTTAYSKHCGVARLATRGHETCGNTSVSASKPPTSIVAAQGGALKEEYGIHNDLESVCIELLRLVDQQPDLAGAHYSTFQPMLERFENLWVVKPSYAARGVGIRVEQSLPRILAHVGSNRIVQKYLERPLLANDRKFDLRCWLLVTSWRPLTVWFWEECIVRRAASSFSLKTSALPNKQVHLTNRTVQRCIRQQVAHSANQSWRYSSSSCSADAKDDLLWSGTKLKDYLSKSSVIPEGAWENDILPTIWQVCVSALKASPEASCDNKHTSHQSPTCCEVLGADLILDEALQPWLLEINESPNLGHHASEVKASLMRQLSDDIVSVFVEPLFCPHRQNEVFTGPVGCRVGRFRKVHDAAVVNV